MVGYMVDNLTLWSGIMAADFGQQKCYCMRIYNYNNNNITIREIYTAPYSAR